MVNMKKKKKRQERTKKLFIAIIIIGVLTLLALIYIAVKANFVSEHPISNGMFASWNNCPAGGGYAPYPCPCPFEVALDYITMTVAVLGLVAQPILVSVYNRTRIK